MWCFSSRVAKATPNWGARVVAPLTPTSFYICPMRRRWLRCNRNRKNAAEAAGNSGYWSQHSWDMETLIGYGPVGICWCILNSIFFYDLPVLCNGRGKLCMGKMKRPHQMAFYTLPICKNIRIISHQPIGTKGAVVQGIANTTNACVGTPFLKVPLAQNLFAARSWSWKI